MSEGERLTAGDENYAVDFARHFVAYDFARERAAGKRVLDAGCGQGYGSARIAESAREVLGLDQAEAVAVAARRYGGERLRFRPFDLARLESLGERFELVVSFQVIEHLPDPEGFLRGLRACCAPSGLLVVTTPNRLMSVSENPYHLREWTAPELLALAEPILPGVRMLGVHGSDRVIAHERARGEQVQRILRLDPLGLRRFIPRAVVDWAFPRLATVVRRRLRSGTANGNPIGAGDFTIDDQRLDTALDLMLLLET